VLGEQDHVLAVAVIAVVSVPTELDAVIGGVVLELPPVVVEVVPFDLVGGRRRPPQETGREGASGA